ncbi:MAG: transposase [Oscillochloridaceae bacterium umkhey_bin13]
MKYDPSSHRRRSIRLTGYDYTAPGAYYLTIMVYHREQIFGRVTAGKVALSPMGVLVEQAWHALPHFFPRVHLDAFVVMPDHMHGIIVLQGQPVPCTMKTSKGPAGTHPGSIPAIVQNFKSVTARQINRANGTPGRRVWQEDYYEHIIRNEDTFERIRCYIQANPSQWRD